MNAGKHILRLSVLSIVALASSMPSRAEENAPERDFSVSISPFHLLCPELHLTGERRLAERASAAVMVGAGQVTDEGKRSAVWEMGGQLRYYLIGSFSHGMLLGVDAGYVDVDDELEDHMDYLPGWRAGGVVGYKIITQSGLTLEFQIGPVYVWGTGGVSEWQTLEALRVGWSF